MTDDDETKRDETEIDTELLLTFFAMFSKFEKALKKAGFTKPGPYARNARADWERFARHIEGRFHVDSAPELQGAVAYLLDRPIKRQTRRIIPGFRSDVWWLSTLIQETVNNLSRNINFEPHTNKEAELLMACLVVLEAFGRCDPDLEAMLNDKT